MIDEVPTYEEKYRDLWIRVLPDFETCLSPDDDWDDDLFIISFDPDYPILKEDIQEVNDLKSYRASHYIFPLMGTINVHGTWSSLSLTSSGHPNVIGAVLVGRIVANDRLEAMKMAATLIRIWNDFLNGECYGYSVIDPKTDMEVGMGCGFYGNWEVSGIIESARQEADDYLLAEARKQHPKKHG